MARNHGAICPFMKNGSYFNPLLELGPDPWALWDRHTYFYTHTLQDRIDLWQTPDLTSLKSAIRKTIWLPDQPQYAKHIWAPEIHRIQGKWYVYFTADDGDTDNHQIYVLENENDDPMQGSFILKGRVSTDPENNWAIDASVFANAGALYMVWSGWQSRRKHEETQCIYIAKMETPWKLGSERVLISKPTFAWERKWETPPEHGRSPRYPIFVNEGPQPLKSPDGSLIHIAYSASGCWTPHYALGLLTCSHDTDPLQPENWRKSAQPVFRQSAEAGVYGTGHCSFFPSPDGTESYILYHARDMQYEPGLPNETIDHRSPRMQAFHWSDDGYPDFGTPFATSTPLPKPFTLNVVNT